MKKRNGFTLIELLAIIVILAVIAVITVPIILDIIENSKKGAVRDSAYGYKDAVHKYYMSRLAYDYDFKLVDNIYSIDEYGYLQYSDSNPSNNITYEILFDGEVPKGGFVQIENNDVKNACISFDQYSVLISDGSVSDVSKGECESIDEIVSSGSEQYIAGDEFDYDYTGNVQSFDVLRDGYYKLEVWGAQGASSGGTGGYGGYSTGIIQLSEGNKLYIVVGGAGQNTTGGYNGGGSGSVACLNGSSYKDGGGGGGATHIALDNNLGELKNYNNERNSVLIVAGGGGGGAYISSNYSGGSGGGISGYNGSGRGITTVAGNQENGYAFGLGQDGSECYNNNWGESGRGGGGGGFYGGTASQIGPNGVAGGAGGSGYIGNSSLTDGAMYSGISSYSDFAISEYSKVGNGYARITYIGKNKDEDSIINEKIKVGKKFVFNYMNSEKEFTVPKNGRYKLEVWGAQGGNATDEYIGGYGGYSTGVVSLNKQTKLYINVGGQGCSGSNSLICGGYNGGGTGITASSDDKSGGGGGATHIALKSGVLSSFDVNENGQADEGELSDILIVAGGGGGSYYYNDFKSSGGSGGGFNGSIAPTGTCGQGRILHVGDSSSQEGPGGSNFCGPEIISNAGFGIGASNSEWSSGGGSGFYGGGAGFAHGANGGSGYIGNSILSDGVMYCYDCVENSNLSTKTISTTGTSEFKDSINCSNGFSSSPISKCAKIGAGYAVITYLGD